MSDSYKVLAQSNPAATTLTDIYTVPGATSTMAIVLICNQGVAGSFRLSVAIAGAADATKQYLHRSQSIDANDTFKAPIWGGLITLGAADVLRFYGSHANFSVNVLGLELT